MPTVRVGGHRLGSFPPAGRFSRAAPAVVITAPAGLVPASPFTVSWTFTSPVARPQTQHRIRILSQDGSVTVFDNGTVASGSSSTSLAVLLSNGSQYLVEVSASDGFDWSPPATALFTYEGEAARAIEPNVQVGSIYEIGLNGDGYMLADVPGSQVRYSRRVIPLDATRLATSDTPFAESIDRYTVIGFSDWSGGAGQRFLERELSSPARFQKSTNINPFERGELRLAPGTTAVASDSSANQQALVVGSVLYWVSGSGQFSTQSTPGGSVTNFTITGAGSVTATASDGTYWYYSDGSNIYRNNTAASAAAWSTSDARVMEWCGDRLVIARLDGAGSTTPNVVAVMAEAGTEVGGSQIWTFQKETNVRAITSGDGYIWWAATRDDKSTIYGWKVGSTDSYFTALELPASQDARSIGYYQGNVFVRTSEKTGSSQRRAVFYRCATSQGLLVPTRMFEIADDSVDHSEGAWSGDDRFVYFSWRNQAGTGTAGGVGAIDLSTGGWCKWSVGTGTGRVRSVVQWFGRTVFTVDGTGPFLENANTGSADGTAASGTIDFSLSDLASGLRKIYGEVRVTMDPLPANCTVTVSYSLDGGVSYVALGTVAAAGTKFASWDLNKESDSIQFRLSFTKSGNFSPVVKTVSCRASAIALADQILILPVNCGDNVNGLNGRLLPGSKAGAGAARARLLENLVQTRVLVQDVDWAVTRSEQVYELIACEIQSAGVYDRNKNRQTQDMVAVLTFRRTLR